MSDFQKKIRAIVNGVGLYRSAELFEVTEESILRYLADCEGAGIRKGTRLVIESEMDAVEAKAAKEAAVGEGGAKPKPASKPRAKAKKKAA